MSQKSSHTADVSPDKISQKSQAVTKFLIRSERRKNYSIPKPTYVKTSLH